MAWLRAGAIRRSAAFRAGCAASCWSRSGVVEEDCASGGWRAFLGEASGWSWGRVGAIRRSTLCRAGAWEGS